MAGRTPRSQEERTRRRFARRQWRRRWLAWKRVVAVLVVVALAGGVVWAVYFSAWLSVQGVTVSGATTVGADRVRAAAHVPGGEPLATVDLAQVQRRVEAMAVVRSADVTREWPDHVRIEIEERVPVAVVEIAGTLRGMDASGVVFRSYDRVPDGMPRVETSIGTRADALREAAKVVGALPSTLARLVDHVEVTSVDQISLALRDGRTVVWGSAEDSATKAEVVGALLGEQAKVYDVSVPSLPTTSG